MKVERRKMEKESKEGWKGKERKEGRKKERKKERTKQPSDYPLFSPNTVL